MGDDGARPDQGVCTYRIPAYDRRIRSDGCVMFNVRRKPRLFTPREPRARCEIVGEDAGWSAEHPVIQYHTFIQRDVILDPAVVADNDIIAHVHILTERAILPDLGAALDMREVPNLGTFTDLYPIVDIGGLMDVIVVFCIHRNLTL